MSARCRVPPGGGRCIARSNADHTPRKIWEGIMIRFCGATALVLLAWPVFAQDIPTRDHTVTVTSTVPAIAGQKSMLYVRERALPKVLRDGAGDKVVLFVHGAGTPAEVSFDVPYQDYSWMGYLAKAGYDVFTVDMTGYGRSTRPDAMNDPCNLSHDQQVALVPASIASPCAPSYGKQMTTIASDWNDIDAVVSHLLALRHIDRLSM